MAPNTIVHILHNDVQRSREVAQLIHKCCMGCTNVARGFKYNNGVAQRLPSGLHPVDNPSHIHRITQR